jgi:hypothetical protein
LALNYLLICCPYNLSVLKKFVELCAGFIFAFWPRSKISPDLALIGTPPCSFHRTPHARCNANASSMQQSTPTIAVACLVALLFQSRARAPLLSHSLAPSRALSPCSRHHSPWSSAAMNGRAELKLPPLLWALLPLLLPCIALRPPMRLSSTADHPRTLALSAASLSRAITMPVRRHSWAGRCCLQLAKP